MRHLVEALTDWQVHGLRSIVLVSAGTDDSQVWVHMFIYMAIITNRKQGHASVTTIDVSLCNSVYGITLFLP